ncbi:MAG: hypothetical protein RJB38_2189, partial [Pseudomonadota bacterium]
VGYVYINGFAAPLGSAAAPAFTEKSSWLAGMYFPTSSSLALTSNGTERLRIASSGNVGIGTSSPSEKLEVSGNIKANGGISTKFFSRTSSGTIAVDDSIIAANAATAAFSLTLPSASGIEGRQYIVKKTDSSANPVTLVGTGSQTIDGASSYLLGLQNQHVSVVSDGNNWVVTGTSYATGVKTFQNMKTFTAAGTFTAPAGVSLVYVTAIGGGGPGSWQSGGGGGGGHCVIQMQCAVTAGSNYNVVVGAGGVSAPGGTNVGGSSSFGSCVTVPGGTAALGATGGSGGSGGGGGKNGTGGTGASGGAGASGSATLAGGGGSGCGYPNVTNGGLSLGGGNGGSGSAVAYNFSNGLGGGGGGLFFKGYTAPMTAGGSGGVGYGAGGTSGSDDWGHGQSGQPGVVYVEW